MNEHQEEIIKLFMRYKRHVQVATAFELMEAICENIFDKDHRVERNVTFDEIVDCFYAFMMNKAKEAK